MNFIWPLRHSFLWRIACEFLLSQMDGTAFTLDQSGKQTGAALVKVRVDSPPQDKHTLESRAQTRASGEEKRPQSRYNDITQLLTFTPK